MPEPASDELHIASFVVHFRPDDRDALDWHLSGCPELDVQVEDPTSAGKMVVVSEAPHQGEILDQMEAIESLQGVLGCSMVYHETMSTREADQQMITGVSSS